MAAAYLAVERGCGKIPYLTEQSARNAARIAKENMMARFGREYCDPKAGYPICAYSCRKCRAWHWGHDIFAVCD